MISKILKTEGLEPHRSW